jgi:hypothetical protein
MKQKRSNKKDSGSGNSVQDSRFRDDKKITKRCASADSIEQTNSGTTDLEKKQLNKRQSNSSIEIEQDSHEIRRSPSSLPYLNGNKNLVHDSLSNLRNAK